MAQETSFDQQIESQSNSNQTHESSRNLGPAEIDFTTPSSWAVVKLPRFILLIGHNGKYLKSARNSNNNPVNMFIADNKMDATVFEVVYMSDGSVGIKSPFYERFLVAGNGAGDPVQALHVHIGNNWRGRFWPVKLGRGTDSRLIGLRLYNGLLHQFYCFNRSDRNNTLSSAMSNARTEMGFELEEPVSQRQIYGVTYHMDRVRISDHEPLTSVTKDVKNWSKTPQKGVLSFLHTARESQSWGSTDSWKISSSVTMSVRIPFIGGPEISAEAYYSGSYEWGEEQETSKEIGTQLQVEVPPMSMVQATMIVQKGKFEVPFSYGQRDTLYNGYSSLTNFPDDGLFSSVNTYVTYETIKRSLA